MHLYVHHLVAFCAIFAVVFIPSVLLTYLEVHPLTAAIVEIFTQAITRPGKPPDLQALAGYQPNDALVGLQWLLGFLGLPLASGAVVVGVSRAYLGHAVRFADAYRIALSRWLPILILIVIWLAAGFVLVVAYVVILGLVFAALGALAGAFGASTVATVFIATLMIGIFIVSLVLGTLLYLVFAVSFIGVILERLDPTTAFARAFGRVFGGGALGRGIGLAVSLAAIYLGAILVLGGAGALGAALLKAPALYFIASGMAELLFFPFAVVVAAVYYYDLRIRREGYDLEMLLERFSAGQLRSRA